MTVKAISGLSHDCDRDGHLIALRLAWDIDAVKVTPFCERCRLIFLSSGTMIGSQAEWLMKQVEQSRWLKEAPPEAYEGMYE